MQSAMRNDDVAHLVNPRPDLAEDAELWARLLLKAWPIDNADPDGLFWALHGLRCLGAQLVMLQGTAKLQPGEIPAEQYAADRARYLVPHAAELRRLLAEIAMPVPAKVA